MNTNQPQIIVGVDRRPETAHVVAWATKEAALRRASILLVHAVGPDVAAHLDDTERWGEDLGAVIGRATEDGQRLLDRARAEIRALDPSVVVEESVTLGAAPTALRNAVSPRSMVVVGPRSGRAGTSTLDPLESQLDGEHGFRVVEICGAPVTGGVVVVSDGTVWSTPVLTAAFELAALHGLPLTVAHVPDPEAGTALHRFLRSMLTEQVHELLDCFPTAEVSVVTDTAEVARVLADAPATASCLVADAEHLDTLPQTRTRVLVPTGRRPEPVVLDEPTAAPIVARRTSLADVPPLPDLTAALESWWDLPAAEPALRPALVRVRVRRRHLRRFGSEA